MSVSEQTIRLEPIGEEHIPVLLAIEQEAYPDPWTAGMFRQEMTNRTSHFFVAYAGEEMAGYGGFWLLVDEVHITKVTVPAAMRGRGFGRQIMEQLLGVGAGLGARTVRLEVRESNMAARRLYESLGLRNVGVRHGYYARARESAVVMVRDLNPPDETPARSDG